MNYILQLSGFFQKVAVDNRLNPTHVSLYMAVFQFWNAERFRNPVTISRQELMRLSKISAKATYHKCIKDLHNFGYIQYIPSYNPFKGSLVYLFDLQSSAKPVFAPDRTNIETSIEQALVPYINNINSLNTNIENESTQSKNDIVLKVSKNRVKVVEVNGEKIEPDSKKTRNKSGGLVSPPDIEFIRKYFLEQSSSQIEADKFFNYFQSNGWKVIQRHSTNAYSNTTNLSRPYTTCFDDLGAESTLKYYGNQCNVMGEILLSRYDHFINNHMITHATTNLSASELESYYGNRVRSRMREMFNLIAFNSNSHDKRK